MEGFMKRLLLILALLTAIATSPDVLLIPRVQAQGTQGQGNPAVKVWVNTASSVYHCRGTRWYGNTKHGEYMSQKDAIAKGNRPAYGKYCN
jgi:hypothetical protein